MKRKKRTNQEIENSKKPGNLPKIGRPGSHPTNEIIIIDPRKFRSSARRRRLGIVGIGVAGRCALKNFGLFGVSYSIPPPGQDAGLLAICGARVGCAGCHVRMPLKIRKSGYRAAPTRLLRGAPVPPTPFSSSQPATEKNQNFVRTDTHTHKKKESKKRARPSATAGGRWPFIARGAP